jgi:hypothetical protein
MKEKKQSGNFLGWDLFKWKMDEEELKNQVENYATLGFFRSARKVATALMIFSAIITLIFVMAGWFPYGIWVDIVLILILALFVYKGKKWAMIVTMIYWTFSKGFQLVSSFSVDNFSAGNIIMPIIWWAIFMGAFWQAYQVERERRKKERIEKNNKKDATINLQKKEGEIKRYYYGKYFFVFFIFTGMYQMFTKNIAPHSLSAPVAFFVAFLEVILDVGVLYFLVLWIMDAIRRRGDVERKENRKAKLAVNIIFAVILIGIIGSILLTFLNQPSDKTDKTIERLTEYFTSEEWKEFNSTIGQFKVLFPVYPEYSVETMPIPDTQEEITVNMYIAGQSDGTTYMVGIGSYSLEIPGGYETEMSEDGVNGVVASTEGNELVSSKLVTFRGYQAIDFLIQNKKENVEIKGKSFLAGQTLYELFVGYYPEKYNENDYNKFINSFQLLK